MCVVVWSVVVSGCSVVWCYGVVVWSDAVLCGVVWCGAV